GGASGSAAGCRKCFYRTEVFRRIATTFHESVQRLVTAILAYGILARCCPLQHPGRPHALTPAAVATAAQRGPRAHRLSVPPRRRCDRTIDPPEVGDHQS